MGANKTRSPVRDNLRGVLSGSAHVVAAAQPAAGKTGSGLTIGLATLGGAAPGWISAPSADGVEIIRIDPARPPAPDDLSGADAVVIYDGRSEESRPAATAIRPVLEAIRALRLGVLLLSDRPWLFDELDDAAICLPRETPGATAWGALAALAHLRPLMVRIETERTHMRLLGERLQRHFDELDHDLRLASRLQQELLPKAAQELERVRFATLFRPCRWVSGDIFDICRIDADHLALYLADAVGHGVAAGLLTMLIKNSVRPRHLNETSDALLRPAALMHQLNEQLVSHDLPHAQFITAWYGTLNTKTLELTYSVAGHPPPLLIDPGEIRELSGSGCLLGVFGAQDFAEQTIGLRAGQRLLLYSDGLEPTLIAERNGRNPPRLEAGIAEALRLPQEDLLERLNAMLDAAPGGLRNADDVSAVVMDVVG